MAAMASKKYQRNIGVIIGNGGEKKENEIEISAAKRKR